MLRVLLLFPVRLVVGFVAVFLFFPFAEIVGSTIPFACRSSAATAAPSSLFTFRVHFFEPFSSRRLYELYFATLFAFLLTYAFSYYLCTFCILCWHKIWVHLRQFLSSSSASVPTSTGRLSPLSFGPLLSQCFFSYAFWPFFAMCVNKYAI